MKKLFIYAVVAILCSCTTPLEYNRDIFSINPSVKLMNINSTATVRERDGQAIAQIMGTSRTNQTIFYKIEWFDANGIKINSTLSRWKKVNLHKNAEFFWKATSPSRRAVSYRVYLSDTIGDGIIE